MFFDLVFHFFSMFWWFGCFSFHFVFSISIPDEFLMSRWMFTFDFIERKKNKKNMYGNNRDLFAQTILKMCRSLCVKGFFTYFVWCFAWLNLSWKRKKEYIVEAAKHWYLIRKKGGILLFGKIVGAPASNQKW